MHEAFDARDQESLEKRRLKAETTSDAPENNRPEIKSIKRLRYALAKALPESMPSQKAFIVTDVPGYLEQVLRGGRAEGVAEAKELSEWWKSTIFSIKEEVSYYGDDDIYEILERVYSRKGPVED